MHDGDLRRNNNNNDNDNRKLLRNASEVTNESGIRRPERAFGRRNADLRLGLPTRPHSRIVSIAEREFNFFTVSKTVSIRTPGVSGASNTTRPTYKPHNDPCFFGYFHPFTSVHRSFGRSSSVRPPSVPVRTAPSVSTLLRQIFILRHSFIYIKYIYLYQRFSNFFGSRIPKNKNN